MRADRPTDLDRMVTIRRAITSRNEFNELESVWTDLGTVFASRKDASDGERLRAAQLGARLTTRFEIRWSPEVSDVTPADRVICEGVEYELSGVKEIGRRYRLELTGANLVNG